jgi:hypothetical protein
MFKKYFGHIMAAICGTALLASNSYAQFTPPTAVDSDTALAVGTIVVGGLVALWGLRKVIKLVNRS